MQSEMEAINELGPEDHDELVEMADEYLKKGDSQQALGHLMLAIKADPSHIATKIKYVDLSYSTCLYAHNPFVEEITLKCLETEELDCSSLRGVWYTLLIHHPVFGKFFGPKGKFERHHFFSNAKPDVLQSRFFLLGLKKLIIYSREFEKMLMTLRKVLLEDNLSDKPSFTPQQRTAVAAAVACYCSYTEYIFETDEAEDQKVGELREKLEGQGAPEASDVAIFACYIPLHHLKTSARIGDAFRKHVDLKEVVEQQIDLNTRLQEADKSIVPLTAVDDGVSQKVRGQYEVFPYPRWRHILGSDFDMMFADRLKRPDLRILVAGCGTGHEPAMFSVMMPYAKILAVDLSRASLSYAINRTREMGLKNIEFRHGDILKLGVLQEKFDLIVSGGVLHHMEDPMAGWKVLHGLLKDDGLMRIGLYSKIARRFILQAQDFIKEKKYPLDAKGMLTFRREAHSVLKKDVYEGILKTADYFNLSMMRDLLFHVQEHDFDIPQIGQCLEELGMEFIKFHPNDGSVYERYRIKFPKDPVGGTLEHWNLYEQQYQDTFRAMYQFWIRKKAA